MKYILIKTNDLIKEIIVYSITILIVGCTSKNIDLNDEFGIIGNVKSINEITIETQRNNDTIDVKNYEFDKNNRVIKMKQTAYGHEYMGDKLEMVTIGEYHYENNLIKAINQKFVIKNQKQDYVKEYYYTKERLDSTITFEINKEKIKGTKNTEKYNYKNGKLINSIINNKEKLIRNENGLIGQIIINQNKDTIFTKYDLDINGNWIVTKLYERNELVRIINRNIKYQ